MQTWSQSIQGMWSIYPFSLGARCTDNKLELLHYIVKTCTLIPILTWEKPNNANPTVEFTSNFIPINPTNSFHFIKFIQTIMITMMTTIILKIICLQNNDDDENDNNDGDNNDSN